MWQYLISFFYTEQRPNQPTRDIKELNQIIHYYKPDVSLTSDFTKNNDRIKNDLLEKATASH